MYCRATQFVFVVFADNCAVPVVVADLYAHQPPDPYSGLPRVDVTQHTPITMLAHDLTRRLILPTISPPPSLLAEEHRLESVVKMFQSRQTYSEQASSLLRNAEAQINAFLQLSSVRKELESLQTLRIVLGSRAMDSADISGRNNPTL